MDKDSTPQAACRHCVPKEKINAHLVNRNPCTCKVQENPTPQEIERLIEKIKKTMPVSKKIRCEGKNGAVAYTENPDYPPYRKGECLSEDYGEWMYEDVIPKLLPYVRSLQKHSQELEDQNGRLKSDLKWCHKNFFPDRDAPASLSDLPPSKGTCLCTTPNWKNCNCPLAVDHAMEECRKLEEENSRLRNELKGTFKYVNIGKIPPMHYPVDESDEPSQLPPILPLPPKV